MLSIVVVPLLAVVLNWPTLSIVACSAHSQSDDGAREGESVGKRGGENRAHGERSQ